LLRLHCNLRRLKAGLFINRGPYHAGDVEQVATALKLHQLLVVGSSVGATYALALAAYLPDRVQAMLLISPSGSTGAVP
jgi:pimeloyl-ACP methyl ester carboxylesterase